VSEIRIPLHNHGHGGSPLGLRVEVAEDGVYLTVDGETADEPSTHRTLTPDEARALADVLKHYAREYER
jgi:hypothetical protein